jgi:hypothetical protein
MFDMDWKEILGGIVLAIVAAVFVCVILELMARG